ncbi:MAG: CBS domain-containing protein [Janthinobacterium lividum]
MKVSDILTVKGNALFTCTPDTPLSHAIDTMAEHDIGSLLVMESGHLVGILTFREVNTYLVTHGHRVDQGTIRAAMEEYPLTCTPETEMNEVRRMMLDHHTRYMPVVDHMNVMGVISFYDVAKAVVEQQGFENKMLKAYIRDWPASDGDAAY